MALETFVNGAISTSITAACTSTATTLTLASTASLPTTGNFRMRIESEIVLVTNVNTSTNVITVQRGMEGTIAAAHANGMPISVGVTGGAILQHRSDFFSSGPYASIPAGKEGMLYRPNDAPYLMRYDKTNGWEAYGPLFKATPPQLSDFTLHGYSPSGADAYTNANGFLYGRLPGDGTYRSPCFVRPYPSVTPFSAEVGFTFHAERSQDDLSGPTGREWFFVGVCFYDSVSDKMKCWGAGFYNVFGQVSFSRNLSTTTTVLNSNLYGSTPGIMQMQGGQPQWYFKLEHDSYLNYWWSRDGYNWYKDSFDTWNDGDLPASTHYGIVVQNSHASQGLRFAIHHWQENF